MSLQANKDERIDAIEKRVDLIYYNLKDVVEAHLRVRLNFVEEKHREFLDYLHRVYKRIEDIERRLNKLDGVESNHVKLKLNDPVWARSKK